MTIRNSLSIDIWNWETIKKMLFNCLLPKVEPECRLHGNWLWIYFKWLHWRPKIQINWSNSVNSNCWLRVLNKKKFLTVDVTFNEIWFYYQKLWMKFCYFLIYILIGNAFINWMLNAYTFICYKGLSKNFGLFFFWWGIVIHVV